MPNVFVQYRSDLVRSYGQIVLSRLKHAIRQRAADELRPAGRQLLPADFSIMFFVEGPLDDLIEDVQVLIFAHAYEARVKVSDELAASISDAVRNVLAGTECRPPREWTYSVALFLGEMGYYADCVNGVGRLQFGTGDPNLMPIEELDPSVRVWNCLTRVGIRTVADVTGATERELLEIPHFGVKSLENTKGCLARFGLRLSDEDSRGARPGWLRDRDKLRRHRDEGD